MVGMFVYKAAALVQVYRDNEDLQFVFPENGDGSSDWISSSLAIILIELDALWKFTVIWVINSASFCKPTYVDFST